MEVKAMTTGMNLDNTNTGDSEIIFPFPTQESRKVVPALKSMGIVLDSPECERPKVNPTLLSEEVTNGQKESGFGFSHC